MLKMNIPAGKSIGRAILGAVCAWGACAHAGERVELKGSTSIELPKPSRSFEETTRFKFDSSRTDLEGAFVPPVNTNPDHQINSKLKEMLDRRRNWIFMNPYESRLDSRTTEILDKDGTGGLLSHPLLKEDEKSMVQKFIEEKGKRRSNDLKSANNNDNSPSGTDPESLNQDQLAAKLGKDDPASDDKSSGEGLGGRRRTTFEAPKSGLEVSDFQKRMERNPFENGIFAQFQNSPTSSLDKDELKKREAAHEADFNKLIQPRSIATTVSSGIDPVINSPVDGTGAAEGARPRGSALTFSSGKTDFEGTGRSSSFSANLPTSGSGLDLNQFGSGAAKQPSFLPSTPASFGQPAPTFAPSPFVHEFPRRKF